ncbi:MAG TPA: Mu-like prophage major head subunit gpT family protein [Planctomycetota bacterium]|nr:Mu-like prophage major head subunit gpT family protein [Planctomycetota bacterium]
MIVRGTVALQAGIRSEFIQAYRTGPLQVPRFCTIIPSDKDTENYAWLGEVTQIREFLGDREITGFTDTKYTLTNKTWEGTIGVKRSEIEDDQTARIMTRARDLGTRAAQHPDVLLWQTQTNNGNCYDGSAFYSTHPARTAQGVAQANTVAQTGTTITAIQADLQSALAVLKAIKDERNLPFWPMIEPKDLVITCSPSLEFPIRTVIQGSLISTTSNLLQGAVGAIYVNPFITGNAWFLHYLGGALKPFVFQDRVPVTLEDQLADSETGFMRDVYLFGSRARYMAGFGLWQASVRVQ